MKLKITDRMIINTFIHTAYIMTICILIMFVFWRQDVAKKWEKRSFTTLELYHAVCIKHNENIEYIP